MYVVLTLIMILLISPIQGLSETVPEGAECVDLTVLNKLGSPWNIVHQEKSKSGFSTILLQDDWLMYFLHWRPLTEERRALSVEYVRKLLLSFWGPSMPFKIVGAGGRTRIAGHPAYYIDGILEKMGVRTRFIIWNCDQSGRQFIADCNINTALETPEPWLKLQFKITDTIACHSAIETNTPDQRLPGKYVNEKLKLSFRKPDNWRTHEFVHPKWYPDGVSASNGSLWTLMTDAEKIIHLKNQTDWSLTEASFKERCRELQGISFQTDQMKYRVENIVFENVRRQQETIVGDITIDLVYIQGENQSPTPFHCRGILWEKNGSTWFLVAGLSATREIWGMQVDLIPTEAQVTKFVLKDVLPAIRSWDK